jgi:pilus assembly protein Flp/PilA
MRHQTEGEMKRFLRDDSAATSIEYALIATLISIIIVGGATSIGQTVKNLFFDSVNAGFTSSSR